MVQKSCVADLQKKQTLLVLSVNSPAAFFGVSLSPKRNAPKTMFKFDNPILFIASHRTTLSRSVRVYLSIVTRLLT